MTPPIQADEFKWIIDNFITEKALSHGKVSLRQEILSFSGNKSYLPIIWDFSFEGTFSVYNSYALITFNFYNVFDRFFNYILGIIWILAFFGMIFDLSILDYRTVSLLARTLWVIILFIGLISYYLQHRLLRSCLLKIPGKAITLKDKDFRKLLASP